MEHKENNTDLKEFMAYEGLLGICFLLDPKQNQEKFVRLKNDVSAFSTGLHMEVASYQKRISKMPISTFVVLWGEVLLSDTKSGARSLKMMSDLLKNQLLPFVSVEEFAGLNSSVILDNIRSFSDWTLSKREEYVLLFTSFSSWLSKETFSYVPQVVDLDLIAAQKRQVSFNTYVNILGHLDLRERILAKMFYLGGSRGLEEVLSTKIEDIDFAKQIIHFSEDVFYPRHVFVDIKDYVQNRKRGYVFLGKEGERISHTTPFRALKKVVLDLNIDPEFTFKEFTKNI